MSLTSNWFSSTEPRPAGPFGLLKRKQPDEANPPKPTVEKSLSLSLSPSHRPLAEIDSNTTASASKRPKLGFFAEDDEAVEEDEHVSSADPFAVLAGIRDTNSDETIPPLTGLRKSFACRASSGQITQIRYRESSKPLSLGLPEHSKRAYYGIDINKILEEHNIEEACRNERLSKTQDLPARQEEQLSNSKKTLLWSEKYRAKQFTDLVGDERTHRSVLRWIKAWDPIVFPHQGKKIRPKFQENGEPKAHRKVLLITGPPGLGKTTLAHVAARQAGYDPLEINASDDRTKDIVKGRIRDCVGTETIKGVGTIGPDGSARKSGKPVCVIVDEVDGVVGGSGGDGGFTKALIDLILLDKRNTEHSESSKKRKGDKFKLLRPMILICNDVYHTSLKPLRQSGLAEIIHIRKPPLGLVVSRMKDIFESEGFKYEGDGVRRLCEAAWGITGKRETSSKNDGPGEGDIRGVMVVAEWAASKLKSTPNVTTPVLTRKWVDQNMLSDLSDGGSSSRGMGRGSVKEVMDRIFVEGAGFASSSLLRDVSTSAGTGLGVAEVGKQRAMKLLREMVDSCGEVDKLMNDCWTAYPTYPYQDDTSLSKPDAAYDWLAFHDTISTKVHSSQEWELMPYLNQGALAFHDLFACPLRHNYAKAFAEKSQEDPLPFSGLRADFEAFEAQKQNRGILQSLQSSLSPTLLGSFRSPDTIAYDLVPFVGRMLTPAINPVQIGGSGGQGQTATVRKDSEKRMAERAAAIMCEVGVTFEKARVEGEGDTRYSGMIYRMEPALDLLNYFETAPGKAVQTRYAVRQVLEQEYQKRLMNERNTARQARYQAGNPTSAVVAPKVEAARPVDLKRVIKRDFFGRVVETLVPMTAEPAKDVAVHDSRIWCSFNEGFSNAVKKPITLAELMATFE